MSITNELREYIKQTNWAMTSKAKWFAIADRIDIEHKKAVDIAFTNGRTEGIADGCAYYDTEHTECMLSEEHGWVRGPLDADGVMWHEGDMSDSVWGEIELIIRNCDGHWYIKGHDTSAPWVRADSIHHQKPLKPLTIEDMLCEFATKMNDSKMLFDDPEEIQRGLIAEYAAKLQLKAQ